MIESKPIVVMTNQQYKEETQEPAVSGDFNLTSQTIGFGLKALRLARHFIAGGLKHADLIKSNGFQIYISTRNRIP